MDTTTPLSASSHATAPYTRHAPCAPFIHVSRPCADQLSRPMTITPSFASVNPGTLTEDDLRIITGGGTEQVAVDRSVSWTYPMRHAAQSILEFLHVGPRTVVRDTEWLRAEGITMVVLLHDVGFGGIMGSFAEKFAAPLGIERLLVPVASAQDLMTSLGDIIAAANRNVVGVFRREGRRGKVLVTCQTGNDRATIVAAAYLMSVFGLGMVDAVNFVMAQRFCANFDEDSKRCLSAWEAIIQARKDVHGATAQVGAMGLGAEAPVGLGGIGKKRRIEDTRDEDEGMGGMTEAGNMDADRYDGREAFIPFIDMDE